MKKFMIILSALIVFLGLTSVFVVDETEQVVILQFGKPVRTILEPGLNIKVPFLFRKKLLLMTAFWNMIHLPKRY